MQKAAILSDRAATCGTKTHYDRRTNGVSLLESSILTHTSTSPYMATKVRTTSILTP